MTPKQPPSGSTPPVDPHAAREADKYDKPIASREAILQVLEGAGTVLKLPQLADILHLKDDDQLEALRRRLNAMQRDGQVHVDRRGRIGLAEKLDLKRCKVIGHREGYGFAAPAEGGDDFFLNSREMQRVFDGDEVLVAITGVDHRGRQEGKIVEVLSRAVSELPGRYMEESGIGFLMPYNTRINQHILIPPTKKAGARPGQMVSVRITDYPTAILGAKGEVIEILGDHLDPGLEIDIAIRAHQIPFEWPDEVLEEAGALGEEPQEHDKQYRVDLRHLAFVTIDGEDARDFDDAVYCEREGTHNRLWVAIADVSHYVGVGSALDAEAIRRGNSVYFPERVVPMFPEVLSNGLCSLKPHVDRLAMVAELLIDPAGRIVDTAFYEAVIHSQARLTYTQVGQVIEQGWHEEVAPERYEDIMRLYALYNVLRAARDHRGAIDFETVETRIIFNEARKIESITPVHRNDAHKLIEECMLAANVATAAFLEQSGLPALYRVHEGPSSARLENLRSFLGELSLDLPGGDSPTPTDYQCVLAAIADREDASIIQTMMLRSLSQAVYQPENGGHFGLHYAAYAHFTSPIRRYPDLLVHRAIRHMIRSRKLCDQVRRVAGAKSLKKEQSYPYTMADVAALGEQCSMTERRADDATREVEAWLKCEFLRDKVGEVYAGIIAAVTGFGIFVELEDLYIEGLVHISALPGDYYHFDQAKQRLIGEHTRRVFQLGGSVTVKVARVDLDDRKIDLEMDEFAQEGGERKPKGVGKRKTGTSAPSVKSRPTKRPGSASSGRDGAPERAAKRRRSVKSGGHEPAGRRRSSGKPNTVQATNDGGGKKSPHKKRKQASSRGKAKRGRKT